MSFDLRAGPRLMAVSTGLVVVVLAHAVVACNSHSPAGPTALTSIGFPPGHPPSPAPVPDIGQQERWNLTATYIGHTGPEACIPPFDGNVRPPSNSLLFIRRAGESIELSTDHTHYVGTVIADEFAATDSDEFGGTWQCGEAKLRFTSRGRVAGRFSDDGRALSAEEVGLFRLESGETVTRYWQWRATRNE